LLLLLIVVVAVADFSWSGSTLHLYQTEVNLAFIKIQFVPRCKHTPSRYMIQLNLYMEIAGLCPAVLKDALIPSVNRIQGFMTTERLFTWSHQGIN
jgi:hypothetical protein